jgi:small subunit ribosomal protein S1
MASDERPEEEEEEDFAALFEAQQAEPAHHERGQLVEGTVVSVGRDAVFVDVGGKGEATIDLDELADEDGQIDVAPGDVVQAVVVSTRGGLKLSLSQARRAANREQLAEAHADGQPVEGKVQAVNKGGFEVRVGGQRAFCPISQIDLGYTEDPAVHVGRTYDFRITEFRDGGKNIVLSRRSVLEEEAQEREAEVRREVVPGAVLEGRVVSVRDFGAFVDLGGNVQGLLHVSEMSHGRVKDPSTIVKPGDAVTVQVLRVDDEQGRISLGLKQLQADPWDDAEDTYEVGQMLQGTVTRVADFGAFVELEPGIEALAHVSTFPPRGKREAWKEQVPPGKEVAVELLSFDPAKKRIGVAVIDREEVENRGARAPEIRAGLRMVGKVERHESYGVFVFLAPGRTGLMPAAESGRERGTDLRKAFPVGSEIDVMVLDVEEGGRRIRLSHKAVGEAEERREAADYAERQDAGAGEGFGSLADKLRAAMRPGDSKRRDDG